MSELLQSVSLQCPCCWETVELLVDGSVADQQYVEDCPVCCRPLVIRVEDATGGKPRVEAEPENG